MLTNDKAGIQTSHPRGEDKEQDYGFFAYLPSNYRVEGQSFPLVIFLHGLGEIGDSFKNPKVLFNVLRHGPPKLIATGKWPSGNPMIVISPQCHELTWIPKSLHQFISYLIKHYRVDPGAIFLTGLSMGGFGTFHYLERYSSHGLISAAVAICGGGNVNNAANIQNVPVWAFHGRADNVIPYEYSIEIINAINAAHPTSPAKLTIYDDVHHDSWTMTYDSSGMGKESREYDRFDESIYDWMLGNRRS